MTDFRRTILGRRLASDETHHTKVNNFVGLSVFSSDALSSVAYATQEILASLSNSMTAHLGSGLAAGVVTASLAGVFGFSVPVAFGIVGLLVILGISYRQTINAYPGGGGAYIVAKENIGEVAAQTAGAALLTDYILTVAVSVSSGIAAITAAWPALDGYNVALTIGAILFIAVANLRGVKESGALFSIPTYGFITCMAMLLFTGAFKWAFGPAVSVQVTPQQALTALDHAQKLSAVVLIWMIMRAYSAGCTALTGVEAISNGVTAFKDPAAKNAAMTMIWMVGLLGSMFLGITLLSHHFDVVYHHSADASVVAETLLSKLCKCVYGGVPQGIGAIPSGLPKLLYYVTQGFTFAVLVVAANTAYADFPRLAALHAGDGFLPKQFTSRGDRLVFSNGIMILTLLACVLVWMFHANTDVLLPLYALGVFLGFTISQTGMVMHWRKLRGKHWQVKAVVNGVGATASAIVMLDIAITKFMGGAWIVIALIPIMVITFFNIHRHYIRVRSILASSRTEEIYNRKQRVVVLVSRIHRGVLEALRYAKAIGARGEVEAIMVDFPDGYGKPSVEVEKLQADWYRYSEGVPLRIIESPFRKVVEPVVDEIDRILRVEPEYTITVVVPEFVPKHWWENFLHNQTALRLKTSLLGKPHVVVISIPYHLDPDMD
jgi:amino acid transporter